MILAYQLLRNIDIQFEHNLMSNKKVLLLVDNRAKALEESYCDLRGAATVDFKGSAFKATEIDGEEQQGSINFQDYIYLSQLQKKVEQLQERVTKLEKSENRELKKKKRRRAAEIERSYKCPYEPCGRFYGTETSLKNHLKLKHKIQ